MQVRERGLWFTSYKEVPRNGRFGATPGMFPSGKLYDEISEPDQETATGKECENSNGNSKNGAESVDDSVAPTSNLEAEVSDLPLERCMRIVPHDQDSGAFFIAVFRKLLPLPGKHLTSFRAPNPSINIRHLGLFTNTFYSFSCFFYLLV